MTAMDNARAIKSYVWYKDKCFFVSTIERDSSSALGSRYNETMVWEYDWEKSERKDKILYQGDAPTGSIATHQRVVEMLYYNGIPE